MAEVEDKVLRLRRELAEHERNAAVAEGEKNRAQASLDAATALLQEEFGVSTLNEAVALAAKLSADLEAETAQVSAALERAGVSGE